MARLTRHLSISGRVQGVGFRWALGAQAQALGLCGWVRNRRDGSVEALVSGEPGAVEALCAWAGEGPPMAHVERMLCAERPTPEASELAIGFVQRATL